MPNPSPEVTPRRLSLRLGEILSGWPRDGKPSTKKLGAALAELAQLLREIPMRIFPASLKFPKFPNLTGQPETLREELNEFKVELLPALMAKLLDTQTAHHRV